MFKRIFKAKFHLRFTFNPVIRYRAENMENEKCINAFPREHLVIVSLTSYEERFKDLEISLYSIFHQTMKPDKIILWLSDEFNGVNDLPYEITHYIKNGLEIRFVKDICSYTKAIYAFREFSNDIIVTADDDIYYPKDWLEKLYYSYAAHQEDIHVHRAHRIKVNNGNIQPYESWEKHVNKETADYKNFLTGVGGVLYPPNCFSKEVLREDIFLKNAVDADDIWFWIMALVHNRKIRVVKNHIKTLTCTNIFRQIFRSGKTLYAKNSNGGNDKQLANLMKYYGSNIYNRLL